MCPKFHGETKWVLLRTHATQHYRHISDRFQSSNHLLVFGKHYIWFIELNIIIISPIKKKTIALQNIYGHYLMMT